MTTTPPRRMTATEDPGPVLALIQAAFAGMEGRIDPPSSMHRLTEAQIAEQAATGEVWVIDGETGPLACVFLTRTTDHLLLTKLATDFAHRREGLARRLVENASMRAAALACRALQLQTRVELTENHAAFAALGFRRTGETTHPGCGQPTSITMEMPVPTNLSGGDRP